MHAQVPSSQPLQKSSPELVNQVQLIAAAAAAAAATHPSGV